MCSIASWSRCAMPYHLVARLDVVVLVGADVTAQLCSGLARCKSWHREFIDLAGLKCCLHFRVASEGLGPFLQQEVGLHVRRGGSPYAVHVFGPQWFEVEVPWSLIRHTSV